MLKALISGVADFAHVQTVEVSAQEPLRRACAYLDAVAAGALIIVASVIFYWV